MTGVKAERRMIVFGTKVIKKTESIAIFVTFLSYIPIFFVFLHLHYILLQIFIRKQMFLMANRFDHNNDRRRDELIRVIEHSVESLSQGELEALYYDMVSKGYIMV